MSLYKTPPPRKVSGAKMLWKSKEFSRDFKKTDISESGLGEVLTGTYQLALSDHDARAQIPPKMAIGKSSFSNATMGLWVAGGGTSRISMTTLALSQASSR